MDNNSDKDKELSNAQIAGGVIGATVGGVKGMSTGLFLGLALAPFLGPLALLIPPAVGIFGTAAGWKCGSKGLSRAAMMVVCAGVGDILPGTPDDAAQNV